MPEEISQAFGENVLEKDLERLAAEVRMREQNPDAKEMRGEDLVRESLKVFAPPPGASPAPAQDASLGIVPNYARGASPEAKLEIEYLIDIALQKGIAAASALAAKTNPFVLDAFHDALAGKLYDEFKRRGILK